MVNGEVARFAGCKWRSGSEGARLPLFIGHSQAAQPPTSPFTAEEVKGE